MTNTIRDTSCSNCGAGLDSSPSEFFCSAKCQRIWMANQIGMCTDGVSELSIHGTHDRQLRGTPWRSPAVRNPRIPVRNQETEED